MLKNISNLGSILNKKEQQSINGGTTPCQGGNATIEYSGWSTSANGVGCGTRTATVTGSCATYGNNTYTETKVCPMETGLIIPELQ